MKRLQSLAQGAAVRFANDDQGQDLIEYALVAALVGLAAVSALHGVSNGIAKAFNNVANDLNTAL